MIKRISVTGPESTGKSMLASELSAEFGDPWVPEFARAYLERLTHPYTFDDVLEIARGQYQLEEKMLTDAQEWLFCDTDFLVTRIWCLVKFGKSHPWIDQMADRHRYAHYLLCNTDIPWEADPLREHPGFRNELFAMYKNELLQRNLPFTVIRGTGRSRLLQAVNAIKLIGQPPAPDASDTWFV